MTDLSSSDFMPHRDAEVTITLTEGQIILLSVMAAHFWESGHGVDPTNSHPNAEDWHAMVRALMFRVFPPPYVGQIIERLQLATPGFREYLDNKMRAAGMPPMNN